MRLRWGKRAYGLPTMDRVKGFYDLAQLRRQVGEGDCAIRIDVDGKAKVIQLYSGSHLGFLPITQIQMTESFADASLERLLGIAQITFRFLVFRVQD